MLSKEETAVARRLIGQYREFAKNWIIVRWLLLAAGLLMLLILFFAWQQLVQLQSFDAVTFPRKPPPEDMRTMLNERIDILRLELKLYIAVFLHAMLGPALVFAALYGWNRWAPHYTLKAKLLETALESEEASRRTLEFMKSEDA
jgi:hypothetical protein